MKTQLQQSLDANVIIDALKDQANTILSSAVGATKLQSFNITGKGNMPYYWQDPRTTEFNSKTYNWISSNLKADTRPYEFDQTFLGQYINVLSKVIYSLSTDDQAKLNEAKANATDQQLAVLNAWKEAMGSLPDGKGQPIDNIAGKIATEWADPATTLTKIQQSTNINRLLNNVPASGKPIVPVFANWLNAIGAAVSLENNTTLNNAYLSRALEFAQEPDKTNGGLVLSEDVETYVPKYAVANGLASIINGLKNESQAAELSMTVKRATEDTFEVNVESYASFRIPVGFFLSVKVDAHANYFQSDIATTSNETTVKMTFPGLTLVNFAPTDFTFSPPKFWYLLEPIREAIKNTGKDISGFKFSPDPGVNFSDKGPFGFLMGAAISNYPSMEITVKSSEYERIQKTFEQSVSVGLTFLGIPLGIGGKESTYSNKVTTNSSDKTVTIKLNPPKELVAGQAVDSVGWVLGVQPNFPAA